MRREDQVDLGTTQSFSTRLLDAPSQKLQPREKPLSVIEDRHFVSYERT